MLRSSLEYLLAIHIKSTHTSFINSFFNHLEKIVLSVKTSTLSIYENIFHKTFSIYFYAFQHFRENFCFSLMIRHINLYSFVFKNSPSLHCSMFFVLLLLKRISSENIEKFVLCVKSVVCLYIVHIIDRQNQKEKSVWYSNNLTFIAITYKNALQTLIFSYNDDIFKIFFCKTQYCMHYTYRLHSSNYNKYWLKKL